MTRLRLAKLVKLVRTSEIVLFMNLARTGFPEEISLNWLNVAFVHFDRYRPLNQVDGEHHAKFFFSPNQNSFHSEKTVHFSHALYVR